MYKSKAYEKVQSIIQNTECKKSELEKRSKELEGLVAGLKNQYEVEVLIDDTEAIKIEKDMLNLKDEKLRVDEMLKLHEVDKMELLRRNQEFNELVGIVKDQNLDKIKELQTLYNENESKLLELKNEFLKLVAMQGEIKRHGNSLSREINETKSKSVNAFYSGVIDNINFNRKEGSIFISELLTERLYQNIELNLTTDEKRLLSEAIAEYRAKSWEI